MARIYLIGPMGSGKSTVGKSLARKLQFEFYDSDREIEAHCGVDIPTIFDFEGETGFRKRERKIISQLAQLDRAVIATGGGIILNRANRKLLRESGHVILLAVDLEEQLRRVALNRNRPLLQVGDVETKLKSLMDERQSLYESTAHHVVSTNSSRMQNVVAKIARHLSRNEIIDAPAAAQATSTGKTKAGVRTAPKTGRKKATSGTTTSKTAGTKNRKDQPTSTASVGKPARNRHVQNTAAVEETASDEQATKNQDLPRSKRKKSRTSRNSQ